MELLILLAVITVVILAEIVCYRRRPLCGWCDVRHYGRCIYNPRAGRVFSNANDGHFDYWDPNK